MDIGLSTQCLAEVSLPEVVRWAAEAGFTAVEVPCLARGADWHDGASLVPGKVDDAAAGQLAELCDSTGVRIAALACCHDMLDADDGARQSRWRLVSEAVGLAARLGVPTVSCLVGRDRAKRLGDCLAQWAREGAETIARAADAGVRLAIATEPRVGLQFEDMPGNAAFCPELWEKLLTHAHSDAVALVLDPAALHWLGVDPVEAFTAYAERVAHVRAADCEVFRDRLSDCSVLRPLTGWWRYRLPGLGEVPWSRLVRRMQEHGYDGELAVVGDDPVWTGSQDAVKRGLDFARRHLASLVV